MGKRQPLQESLRSYRGTWASGRPGGDPSRELAVLERFERFLHSSPDCFERSHPPGHFTGSALVFCPSTGRLLLTLHRKLERWLQLGGHADGCPRLDQVALTEAREESGLELLRFFPYEESLGQPGPLPFDLDVHRIPARPGEPEHLHYDVRFLVQADSRQTLRPTDESRDLRWFTPDEARRITRESSMHRQFDKLERVLL
ncbi:MAG: NUDIX hydrolase [Candidatus Eremiobacterota bacterium]